MKLQNLYNKQIHACEDKGLWYLVIEDPKGNIDCQVNDTEVKSSVIAGPFENSEQLDMFVNSPEYRETRSNFWKIKPETKVQTKYFSINKIWDKCSMFGIGFGFKESFCILVQFHKYLIVIGKHVAPRSV